MQWAFEHGLQQPASATMPAKPRVKQTIYVCFGILENIYYLLYSHRELQEPWDGTKSHHSVWVLALFASLCSPVCMRRKTEGGGETNESLLPADDCNSDEIIGFQGMVNGVEGIVGGAFRLA